MRPGAEGAKAFCVGLEPAVALLEQGSERRAYLLKERVRYRGQLVSAIGTVANGGSVIDPKVVEALIAERQRNTNSPLAQPSAGTCAR
jgi:DNA-binding NarL/FixJ family response regulator